jgi:hypothetical protein
LLVGTGVSSKSMPVGKGVDYHLIIKAVERDCAVLIQGVGGCDTI